MLRRSFLFFSPLTTPPRVGAGLFNYAREIEISPGQLFGNEISLSSFNQQKNKNSSSADSQLDEHDSTPRRWSRNGDELCVAQIQKTSSFLTTYEASYRFDDPQWNPILSLPCGNPVSLEMRARHINYGLRHLVQRGHAFYCVRKTDHSVFHPKGIAAISHVVCSYDEKNERLLTQIVHEGPIDAADPDGKWDIVAASDARSIAQAFQRKQMSVHRSRRIGSLQSQMGTYNWELYTASELNREHPCEAFLLKQETLPFGAGLTAKAIISSAQIAKHPFHYVNPFEAPAQCAVDAFQQAMTISAKHNGLLRDGETLHTIAWKTRSYFPYNPIELDLPFDLHVGPPMVHRGEQDLKLLPSLNVGFPYFRQKKFSEKEEEEQEEDTKTTTNSTTKSKTKKSKSKEFLTQDEINEQDRKRAQKQLTVLQFDVAMIQGASQYIYDEGKAYRAAKFWAQKNALPYECTFYCVRDGLLDAGYTEEFGVPFERMRSRMHSEAGRMSGLAKTLNSPRLNSEQSSASSSSIISHEFDVDLEDVDADENKKHELMTDQVMNDPNFTMENLKTSPATKRKTERQELGLAAGPALSTLYDAYQNTDEAVQARKDNMLIALKKMARVEVSKRRKTELVNPELKGTSLSPFVLPSEKVKSRREKSQKALERIQKKEMEEAEKRMPKKKLK